MYPFPISKTPISQFNGYYAEMDENDPEGLAFFAGFNAVDNEDEEFVKVCDRTLLTDGGGCVVKYLGNNYSRSHNQKKSERYRCSRYRGSNCLAIMLYNKLDRKIILKGIHRMMKSNPRVYLMYNPLLKT